MSEIEWPWQYSFPPFFTIQPNLETRKKQLEAWRNLILKYFKQHSQHILSLSDISDSVLFNNTSISRGLNRDDVVVILEFLATTGNAEPFDKSKNRWYIYWHSLEEWARIIYVWVQKNGFTNSVVTLYDITNAANEEFSNLHEDVLMKALKVLETQDKAEIISLGENSGVKFFN